MPDQPSPSPVRTGKASSESVAQTDLEPREEQAPPPTDQLETTKVFQPNKPPETDTAFADDPAVAHTDPQADANATQAPPPKVTRSPGPDSGPVSGVDKGGAVAKTAVLGDFRLVKKLGVGGMGQVFKGRQISLDRDVAVKVLSKQLAGNPAFVQRFYREARIMARLDHPHIVRCYGVGEAFGWHYLAMEYLDGGSLQDRLKKLGKLSLGDALHVILACAHALQHAHELEMIHRDIKPDNILLTGKGLVKVADLGLAKALSEELNLTQTGTGAGTPYYMAPEQSRDAKHVDHRSDIYSLGVMLYCFVTGQLPFQGDSTIELVQAKEKGKFAPARQFNPEIPERLDLIIDKMLAKEPRHRYQSCAELILDLDGLDLANKNLTCLEDATAAAGPRSGFSSSTKVSSPTRPVVKGKTKVGTRLPMPSASPPEEDEAPSEWWFIAYTTPQRKTVTRKMTEPEVMNLINEEHFDPRNTQACRTLKGNYRDLATYREFAQAVRKRMTQARANRKSARLRDMYQKIEEEQKHEKKWRWVRNLVQTLGGWVSLLIWLACLAALAVAAFFLIRFLINWLGAKVNSLEKEKKAGETTRVVPAGFMRLGSATGHPRPSFQEENPFSREPRASAGFYISRNDQSARG